MTKKRKPDPGPRATTDLGVREETVLRAIIRQHIQTGEPIGSKSVSRGPRLDLSAATIRNVMAELEERGLLIQPHTSAGRLPTTKAYRLYVDKMLRKTRMSESQTRSIEEAMFVRRGEVADLLSEASRQLSRFSHQIGVVLAPEISKLVVEHLEFVRLDDRRVVAILVGRSGVVHNRILDVDEPVDQSELDQIGRYLSDEFGGRTLPEVRRTLETRARQARAEYDRMIARGLELGRRTVEVERGADVFVQGTANLLDSPEFAEPAKLKSVMKTLERKRTLIDLLGRVLDERGGVQVVLGEDQPQESGLADCALVAARYGAEDRVVGTLGIVGPQRMEYAQAIALVGHVAQVLNRYLSRDDLTRMGPGAKFLP